MYIKFPDFIWSNFSYIDMFTSRTHGDVMWLFKSLQDEITKLIHIEGCFIQATSLPPANEVCDGYVFTGVCLSTGWWGGDVPGGGGGSMRGSGMHGGHVWWGGMRGRGAHAWQGGCVWQGACVAGGGGVRVMYAPPGRYYGIRSMSGRYASYWNAFLLFLQTQNSKSIV